jgi:L-rhamnose mutarotase
MHRVLWIGQLNPDRVEEYSEKHLNIWPEMVTMIKEAGVSNYSIFVNGLTVVGYYECDNLEKTRHHQEVAAISAEWGKHMDGCFTVVPQIVSNEVMYIA